MTEVPQATAREEAIELIAALIEAGGSPHLTFEQEAAEMLDALLSPRTVPCATCGGEGWFWANREHTETTDCPNCKGAKTVTLGPLAVLVGELHEVDYQTWVETPFHEGPPVYRLPASKEPHA